VPVDLVSLVDPAHTALVTQECQEAVIGERSMLPQLADAARRAGLPANVARLVRAARAAGVPVVHGLALSRADGRGGNRNARLFGAMARHPGRGLVAGSAPAAVLAEIGTEPSDIEVPRIFGLSPMAGTGLDPILRNLGVTTVVGVGVSLNVAIPNFAFDAVNLGYQFVVPRDAVAGVPDDYAAAVLDNTLSLVATVTTTAEVLSAWG
jgi:biuret amidohydrolase